MQNLLACGKKRKAPREETQKAGKHRGDLPVLAHPPKSLRGLPLLFFKVHMHARKREN